jgi:hypothetical protein
VNLTAEAAFDAGVLRGEFAGADDTGAVELHRKGDAKSAFSAEAVGRLKNSEAKILSFWRANCPNTKSMPSTS